MIIMEIKLLYILMIIFLYIKIILLILLQYKTFIVVRYLLIEKAFAKMNDTYFNINGWFQGINASYALTGIIPIQLRKSLFSLDELTIYNIIKTIFKTENLKISGTKDTIFFKGLY